MTSSLATLEVAKVITIPGGSFGEGGEGHLRISFGGELHEIMKPLIVSNNG